MDDFFRIVLYFSILSIAGYVVEFIGHIIWYRKIAPRGFLFGPYLPIYGWGCLLIMFICTDIRNNIFLTFIISMVVCTALEYLTSFVMEKMFKVRWWDYSDCRFNLNGRICLRNALVFGIVGSIFMSQILPILDRVIDLIPRDIQIISAIFMLVIFSLDTIASTYANCKAKNMEDFTKAIGDQTIEIKRNARKAIKQLVKKRKTAKKPNKH